eukprot:g1753.t1
MSLKEGWLKKKGGGHSMFGRSNWKKRYFVLKPTCLRYFEDESKTSIKGEIEFSALVVSSAVVKENAGGKKYKFCFALATKERVYMMRAADATDEAAWTSTLREAIVAFRDDSKARTPVWQRKEGENVKEKVSAPPPLPLPDTEEKKGVQNQRRERSDSRERAKSMANQVVAAAARRKSIKAGKVNNKSTPPQPEVKIEKAMSSSSSDERDDDGMEDENNKVNEYVKEEQNYPVAVALYDFNGKADENELTFTVGDKILILEMEEGEDWWVGSKLGDPSMTIGDFPSAYVRVDKFTRKLTKAGAAIEREIFDEGTDGTSGRGMRDGRVDSASTDASIDDIGRQVFVTGKEDDEGLILPKALELFKRENAEVYVSGYLKKRGEKNKEKASVTKRNWKTRFFAATLGGLYYFEKDSSETAKGGVLWQDILEPVNSEPEDAGRNFAFSLNIRGRKLYLAAASSDLHKVWVEGIQKVLKLVKEEEEKSLSTSHVDAVAALSRKKSVAPPLPARGASRANLLIAAQNAAQNLPALHHFHSNSIRKWGMMTKQGGGTSALGRKKWKKRFFVLTKSELIYFENEKKLVPRGQFSLNNVKIGSDGTTQSSVCSDIKKSDAGGKKNVFSIEFKERKLFLDCDSSQQRDEWIQEISTALKEMKL